MICHRRFKRSVNNPGPILSPRARKAQSEYDFIMMRYDHYAIPPSVYALIKKLEEVIAQG